MDLLFSSTGGFEVGRRLVGRELSVDEEDAVDEVAEAGIGRRSLDSIARPSPMKLPDPFLTSSLLALHFENGKVG